MLPANSLIPIHDENPTSRLSIFTIVIIALNVVAFFATPGLGMSDASLPFFLRWGVIPWEFTHGQNVTEAALQASGLPVRCIGECVENKNILLSLLTSMFLHGGFLHIGGNMLFLWVFGNNIEDTLRPFRFVVFYLLTGLAAGYAHILVNPESAIPTVGASGAVAGLLGAYVVLFPKARVLSVLPIFFYLTTVRLPALAVIGLWFVSQFFIGLGQQSGGAGVAWMAHVGGFIAGAVLILVFSLGRRRPPPTQWA